MPFKNKEVQSLKRLVYRLRQAGRIPDYIGFMTYDRRDSLEQIIEQMKIDHANGRLQLKKEVPSTIAGVPL